MLNRVLSIALSAALVAPQAFAQTQDIGKLGASVAENMYQLGQISAQLKEAKVQLSRVDDLGALDTYRKTMTGVAVATTAAAVYLGVKAKKSQDIRMLWYGAWALVSGGAGVATGINATGATIYSNKLTREAKADLLAQIEKMESKIHDLGNQAHSDLARLASADPNFKLKLIDTLKSEKYQLARMEQLRTQLGEAKASLYTENAETNLSLVLAGSSFYGLARDTMKGDTGSIVASLASSLIYGAWVKKNQEQKAELKRVIANLEAAISTVETEYRNQLVQSFSNLK